MRYYFNNNTKREREKEGQFFLRKRERGENTLFSLLLCVRDERRKNLGHRREKRKERREKREEPPLFFIGLSWGAFFGAFCALYFALYPLCVLFLFSSVFVR